MSPSSTTPRTRRFARTTAVLAATALVGGNLLAAAPSAAAAAPLVAACVFTDPNHVTVTVDGGIGLLGLANIATVTLTNSDTGALLGIYPDVSLLNGQIHLSPQDIPLPTGTGGINYSIQPIPLLNTIVQPILGSSPCLALPVQQVTGSYEVLPSIQRILDTRKGLGAAKIPAKGTITLTVAGKYGIPGTGGLVGLPGSAPSAVNINLTATNAGAPGYLTVYPTGAARPAVSNLNFAPGKDIANTAIAALGTSGRINIYNDSTKPVDLVGDVSGYYITGVITKLLPLVPGAYQPLTPVRLLDTRKQGVAGKLGSHKSLAFTVAGVAGVPSVGTGAVVLNVTATNPTFRGHLRAYPDQTPLPFASNVNFDPGKTVANVVVVQPGADGKVAIYNGGSLGTTDVVVDVIGYIQGGLVPVQTPGLQNAVTPKRLLDTRYGIGGATAKVPAGGTRTVKVTGGEVPTAPIRAAVITVTATFEGGPGYVTVYPGPTRPNSSILNFVANTDVANVMIAPVNAQGNVVIFNGSTKPADLLIDISAYITGATASVG